VADIGNIPATSSGGGGAPTGGLYLTLGFDGGLSDERRLTFEAGVFGTADGGPNADYAVTLAAGGVPLSKLTGVTRGAVPIKGAAAWTELAPGTIQHVLTSNGPGADPSYQAPAGGAPTGPAGGSLAGTYPNPTIAASAITHTEVAAANKDGAAATPSMRTLGTTSVKACAGDDSRLSDSRAPTGSAGGSLGGTYPNPSIAAGAVGGAEIAAAIKDAAAGTASLRTLSTTGTTACAGNDSRLSDARAPTGAAGGALGGTYPNPTLAAHATSHKSGGGDAIKLDELAAPTDVTTLNASGSAHGLLPKLSGSASDVLKGDGSWGTVGGTGDVVGPASSVASEIVLFDGTTGKLIKAATGTGLVKATSGVYSAATLVTADVGDDQVTYAKIQDVSATDRILGRDTAGAGIIEELTVSAVLDFGGTTRGSIYYRGASGWAILTPGASGTVLKSNGAGADPAWDTVAGSGDVVGPASSVASEIVLFDGTTGKLIKAATGTGLVKATSGVYSAATLVTADVADAQITLAKMADLAANKLIGRATASTGVPEAVGLGRDLAMDAANTAVGIKQNANYFSFRDDFIGCFPSTGVLLGDVTYAESLAGGGSYSVLTGEADHPGIIRATTGATSGNANRAFIGNSASNNPVIASDFKRFFARFRVPTATSYTIAIGFGQDMSAANLGTAGVFFIASDGTASGAIQFVTRSASASSTQTSDVTLTAGNWYDVEVTWDGSHWTPTINGAAHSLVASSANEPTTSALNFGWLIATSTTAARTMDMDTLILESMDLGQRYT
jgi:hypothetical protein